PASSVARCRTAWPRGWRIASPGRAVPIAPLDDRVAWRFTCRTSGRVLCERRLVTRSSGAAAEATPRKCAGGERRSTPRHAVAGRTDSPDRDRCGYRPAASAAGGGLLDALDVDRDLDLVAHREAAAVERLVPHDAEVLAVDLGGGARAGAGHPHRVLDGRPAALHVEDDLLRDPVQGQVAGHLEAVVPRLLDLLRGEGDGGVLRHVEEVGALQVLVALRLAGVDGGHVDGRLDLRVREILVVGLGGA